MSRPHGAENLQGGGSVRDKFECVHQPRDSEDTAGRDGDVGEDQTPSGVGDEFAEDEQIADARGAEDIDVTEIDDDIACAVRAEHIIEPGQLAAQPRLTRQSH